MSVLRRELEYSLLLRQDARFGRQRGCLQCVIVANSVPWEGHHSYKCVLHILLHSLGNIMLPPPQMPESNFLQEGKWMLNMLLFGRKD